MKIKRILISQPKPENDKSPYHDIARKYSVQIDFHPFIKVEQLNVSDFRRQKVYVQDYSAVIFTSKVSVDHFFRMCEDLRYAIPETLKYFCITEAIALYTQKYIVYRKRKIFFGNRDFNDLLDIIKKHSHNRFLLPTSDVCKEDILKLLENNKIKFTQAVFYKTVPNDMSEVGPLDFDMLIFFSPEGIKSLYKNYPDFTQGHIKIGGFGYLTTQAIIDAGLRLDLSAPTPEWPSMARALDNYLQHNNSGK
ncbi:MAG: uroporphyrinogen-III synthase [Bacteroidales bacterium]|nr:uroporphyrinogen-III synthase [Bacteroidales bacterium]MDZ4205167.1 uroporphyrinogen-III synthase [Bacteroidales bacterium]